MFTGTVLVIEAGSGNALDYRMTFYTDVGSENDIREKYKSGSLLTDGDRLYLPMASGYRSAEGTHLIASIDRYTRAIINDRLVLLRDDALRAWQHGQRLYDYGILIRVADTPGFVATLDDVKHESIKVLYQDRSKPWKDPFVSGPNER